MGTSAGPYAPTRGSRLTVRFPEPSQGYQLRVVREVLLALLAKEPSHGYQLRGRLRLALGPLADALNAGQVYVTLARLEKAGLVSSQRVGQTDRPDRKVYELTAAGHARVEEWLQDTSWPKPAPAEFHLKLVAAAAAGRSASVSSRERPSGGRPPLLPGRDPKLGTGFDRREPVAPGFHGQGDPTRARLSLPRALSDVRVGARRASTLPPRMTLDGGTRSRFPAPESEEALGGGMGSRGRVIRVGDTVRRPVGRHSTAISLLLEHLAEKDFLAPVPAGRDEEGRQIFPWIDGEVPVPPYPPWSLSDDALASVGQLVRHYHDTLRSFSAPPHLHWSGELADPQRGSIVCHNDVCPENVVFRGGEAVALIDFDLAAPGRPVWDLASAARMWIPLRPPELAGERGHLDPFSRLAVLADAYGLEDGEHEAFVEAIMMNKRLGTRLVERRVSAGEPAFVEAWEQQGGKAGDDRVIAWLDDHRAAFLRALAAFRPGSSGRSRRAIPRAPDASES